MLNTDVELIYDIDVDNYGAGTKCTIPSTCAEASTKSLVESYANVRTNWIYFVYNIVIELSLM